MIQLVRFQNQASRDSDAVINTTSRSEEKWSKELSPFFLGPIPLQRASSTSALRFENAWQYSKVYAQFIDESGAILPEYAEWSKKGFEAFRAVRFPMGKGAAPSFSLWNGERLGYVDSRLKMYIPEYAKAVQRTDAFQRLVKLYENSEKITLVDFDGYDHDAQGKEFDACVLDPSRPLGHSFVLKAMLKFGESFSDWLDGLSSQHFNSQKKRRLSL